MWNLRLYIVTWNVSQKYPDNLKLNDLLDIEPDRILPDLYIVGLQEVNANPQNVITSFFKADPWVGKLKELLKPLDYICVKSDQLQGLLLTVFVKRKHLYHIREIESEYTRTGFGGMWGNKGGIALRMDCYGSSVCMVNSHLAAHDEMIEERINDYQRIKEATHFSVKVGKNIFEHDYVFWFGDLNFRLFSPLANDNLTPQEIRDKVKKDQLNDLIKMDQLSTIMCQGRAFSELVERLPQFPPTFKFVPDSNDYDMKRRPAWCDRILYKAKNKILKNVSLHLEQISYKSHPSYSISDHKPVSSEFTLIAKELYRKNVLKPKRPSFQSNPIRTPPLIVNTATIALGPPTEMDHVPSDNDDGDIFYDCNDFSDDDIDQAPDDGISDNMQIRFRPFNVWNNSEDNLIEYSLPPSFLCNSADWVGVFREEFMGFDEYLGYEYAETKGDKPQEHARTVSLNFSASIDLPLDGRFVFLYFSSTGIRGYSSMIGMSEPFTVIKRYPSPRPDTID